MRLNDYLPNFSTLSLKRVSNLSDIVWVPSANTYKLSYLCITDNIQSMALKLLSHSFLSFFQNFWATQKLWGTQFWQVIQATHLRNISNPRQELT